MAGAVAYSFVLSLFPFCIFLGHWLDIWRRGAGQAGGRAAVPDGTKTGSGGDRAEVMAVMGQSRFGLLTFGVFIALFFATSAIESLRAASISPTASRSAALPGASPRARCSWWSARSACWRWPGAWGGPRLRRNQALVAAVAGRQRLGGAGGALCHRGRAIGLQLLAYHLWLTAGQRTLLRGAAGRNAERGALAIGGPPVRILAGHRRLLALLRRPDTHHERAGVFQVSSLIVILGAEFNRGIVQMKRMLAASGDLESDLSTVPLPPSMRATGWTPEAACRNHCETACRDIGGCDTQALKATTMSDTFPTACAPIRQPALRCRTPRAGVGVRFKGQEKNNVEEYCVSEGWVRLSVGNTRDRKGRPLTVKLKGPVEPYFRAPVGEP
jgi:hypothetical protein